MNTLIDQRIRISSRRDLPSYAVGDNIIRHEQFGITEAPLRSAILNPNQERKSQYLLFRVNMLVEASLFFLSS